MERTIGTVKWFDQEKGFGFLVADDGSPDVFVHVSAVQRAGLSALTPGQRLSYEVSMDRRSRKIAAAELILI